MCSQNVFKEKTGFRNVLNIKQERKKKSEQKMEENINKNDFRKEKRNTSMAKKQINIIREYSYNLMLIPVRVSVY